MTLAGVLSITLALAAAALAQTTQTPQQPTQTTTTTQTTQAIQNPDGTWTVIEYPANREVTVEFGPSTLIPTARGRAIVHRMADHTMVNLDLSGLSGDVTSYNLYAVDAAGIPTLLGPVTVKNGIATQQFTTPLNRFMLVLSPEGNLTTIAADTPVLFRSAVPQGFAVIPLSSRDREDGAAVGEKVSAVSSSGATPSYAAPMLNIPGMKRGDDAQIKVNFAGAMTGARANINVEPRKDGPTMITARFHELKEAPAGKVYVLWAVSPDNKFVKLGQIVNTGGRNEAEIKSETALPDFGLLVTLEDEISEPHGDIVGTVIRP